jgi:hypothetical protein
MSKLLSALIIGCSIIGVAPAHAGGCSIGIPRAAHNRCSTNYSDGNYGGGPYERYYERWHDAYYGDYGLSRVVDYGLCFGRGTHRVCNDMGLCWRSCN